MAMTVTIVNTSSLTSSSNGDELSTATHISIVFTPRVHYMGTATGTYTDSSVSGLCCGTDAFLTSPTSFPVNVTLALTDVCDTSTPFKATVTVDALGASSETWNLCGNENGSCVDVPTNEGAMTNSTNVLALMAYWSPIFTFTFPMSAQSRMTTVAEQKFMGSGMANSTANLMVDVYHTPNPLVP